MAYIVLALGVLMSLVGLGAMATGYPIIEVERGWATVIAGSVLLSGGVVTAALGLVVRVLVGLEGLGSRSVLAQVPATASRTVVQAMASPAIDEPVAPAQPAIAAAAAPAVSAFAAAVPVAATAAFGSWKMHEETAAPDPVAAPPSAGSELNIEAANTQHAQEPDYLAEDVHAPMDEAEHAYAPPEPEATPHDAHQPEPEPLPPRREELAPQNEAWLDQAFQAFDYEMGGHPAATGTPATLHHEPEAAPPTQAHTGIAETPPRTVDEPADEVEPRDLALHDIANRDLAHDDLAHHDLAHDDLSHHDRDPAAHEPPAHEPVHEPSPALSHPVEAGAPATAPEEPSNLAVIGRYDSEGTSYVMYADGSIEAQSEAGVYRFGSMAELKAFIEG